MGPNNQVWSQLILHLGLVSVVWGLRGEHAGVLAAPAGLELVVPGWNTGIWKFSIRTLQHQRAGAACKLVNKRQARAKELEPEVSRPRFPCPAHRPMQRYACPNSKLVV
ncbi:hypothetical protein PPTG_21557 [Phytophthora nicotianae INRA-310]|uniref:Secreted protein n=1 Tax=Phytophthora nicotianae (strain INRA-310) TaxID=761204 RepID=W2R175_PHYN3|nr:hypothetical protein PPTG_21557 [Phytophthora nicotianae INRA-310]ETN18454.1 hypothetical protein PPTG_21557 [Phytophthora nicotianae INRA-310]